MTDHIVDITEMVCPICGHDHDADDPPTCDQCAGSGEGQYDGTRCWRCRGSGVDRAHMTDKQRRTWGVKR